MIQGRLRGTAVMLLSCLACLLARTAAAQLPDRPYVGAGGRVTFAGEVTATGARRDTDAFFDYTDYNHDALRAFRVRLLGEFRLPDHVAVLGEFRTENTDSAEAAALYLRWRPWTGHAFDVQAGRIPPVIGVFPRRAYGRDNLLIGTPLVYQYLTSLRPDALPATVDDLLRMRARGWRTSFPIGSQTPAPGTALVSAFHWDTGVQAHWEGAGFDLAGALTRGSPAVPVVRDTRARPAWSGRAATEPIPGLTLGVSGARGQWISESVLTLLPEDRHSTSTQTLIGTDAEFGRGPVLVRAEWLRTQFELPFLLESARTSPLVSSGGFVEGRYRFLPRWEISARAERLDFSDVRNSLDSLLPWDAPVQRFETAVGFRALRNFDVRVGWQRNHRDGGRVRQRDQGAVQFLYWF